MRCVGLGAAGDMSGGAEAEEGVGAGREVAGGGMCVARARAGALASAIGRGGPATESLSHREHQVFRLLTLGHTVSEIGAALSLAPNTVSTYRARILEKTGTKNDVELALYSERHARDGMQG